MNRRLIFSFDELSEDAFASQATEIVTELSVDEGAAWFPEPWGLDGITLDGLKEELANYQSAKSRAALGDRREIAGRKAARAGLSAKLRKLAGYLMHKADGDLAKLEATGFKVSRERSAPGKVPLPGPLDLQVRGGALHGSLVARCRGVKGARMYEMWVSEGDPSVEANWRPFGPMSTPVRAELQGLTPGAVYYVRVRAVNHVGPGAWSNAARGRASG